ncbi:MAG: ABC transporter permease [Acidobacteriia bacterium]|nr:ABC transporter permease [Terriglobia bacterium]
MLSLQENIVQSVAALRAYRLRSILTIVGLTMGVATIITVMTLIQGANIYVEEKIANLGSNAFQISRIPLAATDFNVILKALKNKHLTIEDMREVQQHCLHCAMVGARASHSGRVRYVDTELTDTTIIGQTATMAEIDTRTVLQGRYFTPTENQRASQVCLIGAKIAEDLFSGLDPLAKSVRVGIHEFMVIGTYEKIGSVLGQDQDNFLVIPMGAYQKMRGSRISVVIEAKAAGAGTVFEQAQDEARLALRAKRQLGPTQEDDFFIGTAASYIELWHSISAAFFAVFIMVSAISAIVGGIVIMNVMLVSVTERTKEIGIRRAVGATQSDILGQFLSESVLQCLLGGIAGIGFGFAAAVLLRTFTSFPASVQTAVALFGFALSSGIGLFFGIYPATRAARLDPVEALRAE